MRCPNVIEIDASALGSSSTLVPRDISNTEVATVPDGYDFGEIDAYEMGSESVKADYAVKVVNDADQAVDATVCVTTSEDDAFEDYDTDGTASVSTGSSPSNVELLDGSLPIAAINVDLTASTTPSSGTTVKIVFDNRLHGGA